MFSPLQHPQKFLVHVMIAAVYVFPCFAYTYISYMRRCICANLWYTRICISTQGIQTCLLGLEAYKL